MKKNIPSLLLALLVLCMTPVAWADYPEAEGFEHTGYTHDPELQELSGLAASHRHEDVYWTHNDSGNQAELFAIRPDGTVVARVRVRGASQFDWEDIASWVDDEGQGWLAIGDIGDNFAIRRHLTVYVVPEPSLTQSEVEVARTIHLHFSNGPRDAESLAVDWPNRQLLILDKGIQPATLYAAPLMKDSSRAEPVATLPPLFPNAPALVQPLGKNWRGAAASMDLTREGRHLAVLTYRHIYFFERRGGETWQHAVQRHGLRRELPRLGGFEALAWDAAGRTVLICNEGEWVHYYRAAGLIKSPSDIPVPDDASGSVSTPPESAHTSKATAP